MIPKEINSMTAIGLNIILIAGYILAIWAANTDFRLSPERIKK